MESQECHEKNKKMNKNNIRKYRGGDTTHYATQSLT